MAPRKLKPRSRKIRESFCEDLLPRKLAKETFKAQNPGFKYVCRQLPQMYRIHYSQISPEIRESFAKAPRKIRESPVLAGMAPPHLIGEWNQRFQDALHCGKRGTFVTCFPRKLAKVYFRHMDAAKEKHCIAKGSRKRWRKGRQNRTQGNWVLATAHVDNRISMLQKDISWLAIWIVLPTWG